MVVVMGGRGREGRRRGVTLTLRHTDLRVKTTGSKSHDPLKLGERRGRARGREGAEANAQWEGRGEGSAPRSVLFTLVFPSAGLTQVSADMLGASPGVDYNIKTTRGRARAEQQYTASFVCFYTQQNSSSCCCQEMKLPRNI